MPPNAAKSGSSSHARASKARLEQQRRQRQRMILALVAFAAVIAVVVVLVVVKASQNKTSVATAPPPGSASPSLAPTTVVDNLAAIPVADLAAAAKSGLAVAPKALTAPPPPGQTDKPEVFYVGAEFCPYCAAERWAVVTALAKFGQFKNLGQTHSASGDVDPNTPTFSFYGASYTSPYLAFSAVEQTTNQRQGSGYAPLQSLTSAQQDYVSKYGNGGIPFVSLASKFVVSTQYDPAILQGKTFDAVAADATNPATTIGKSFQAAAGVLVGDLCQLTNAQPAAVCSAFSGTGG